MDTIKKTYGLLIEAADEYQSLNIIARMVTRENDSYYPINCRDIESDIWGAPKHMAGLALDGLQLRGHYYDRHGGGWELIGFYPVYRDVFSMDQKHVLAMAKTIKRVNGRIEADQAHADPGDSLMAFAQALKLDFCVIRAERQDNGIGSGYAAWSWVFMPVGEGRVQLRRLIADNKPKAANEAAA